MMKKIVMGNFMRIPLHLSLAGLIFLTVACDPTDNTLGTDLLPPGDSILVFTDTIMDFSSMIVIPEPIVTSISADNYSTGRTYLLGSRVDSVTGISQASIVTQVALPLVGIFGDDPVIDSLEISFYVAEVEGDTAAEMNLKVYEFTEDLDAGETYYSDFDVTGKYDPEPLIEETFKPVAGEMHTFYIENESLRQRMLAAARDTVFESDARFKEIFKGFYITTEQVSSGGSFAKLQLPSNLSRFGFRYLHDSISPDTATYKDYDRYYMSFYFRVAKESGYQYLAQSLNIFEHDKTGSIVEPYLDDEELESRIFYLQGMAGLNVRLSLPDELMEMSDEGPVAINSARLIFPAVPDTVSGIPTEEFPGFLMVSNISAGGTKQIIYDFLVNPDGSSFGKLSRRYDVSAFVDPVYYYSFNIGMHIQAVLNKDIAFEDSDLLLFMRNPFLTSENMQVWSNHLDNERRPRLELIYSRF